MPEQTTDASAAKLKATLRTGRQERKRPTLGMSLREIDRVIGEAEAELRRVGPLGSQIFWNVLGVLASLALLATGLMLGVP